MVATVKYKEATIKRHNVNKILKVLDICINTDIHVSMS